jgi:hypothetical protein
MAKGKGRQSLGFQNKAHKAQFFTECTNSIIEEKYSRKSTRAQITTKTKERPTIQLSVLQYLLQERQHADRIEYTSARQRKNHISPENTRSRPGSLLYFEDNTYDIDQQGSCKSLQSLCLRALVPILPQYMELMGEALLQKLFLFVFQTDAFSNKSCIQQRVYPCMKRKIYKASIFLSSQISFNDTLLDFLFFRLK